MTYKYSFVRRAIYEDNPISRLNSSRNFSDMVRVFKWPYWIMLVILLLATFAILPIGIFVTRPITKNCFVFVCAAIIIGVAIFMQVCREKHLYNESVRADEWDQVIEHYAEYVTDVRKILLYYKIDTPEKLAKLQAEGKAALTRHENGFIKLNSKIFDMLIGVPLGVLISSMIYENSNALPTVITSFIILGSFILGLVVSFKHIIYYTQGYFKDQYLLNAINELEYAEKELSSSTSS